MPLQLLLLVVPIAVTACVDAELQGRLQLELRSEAEGARLDLFDADRFAVSLAEGGRAIGVHRAETPVLEVARGPGSYSLDLLHALPTEGSLVLIAWADASWTPSRSCARRR